jgi:hypothetical protein
MQDSSIRDRDQDQDKVNLENKENRDQSNYHMGYNQRDMSGGADNKYTEMKGDQSRKFLLISVF